MKISLSIALLGFASGFSPTPKSSIRNHFSHSPLPSSGSSEGQQFSESTKSFLQKGNPSSPGWKNKNLLNDVTDWATSDEANRPIICEYEPDAGWLWRKWRGTALSMTYVSVLINIALGITLDTSVHASTEATWPLLAVPPPSEPIIQELSGMKTLWEYNLTLCTFILAFFTSQAYNYWRQVYFTTRAIQGRINDVCLIITASAARSEDPNKDIKGFNDEAAELVETCTRLIRLR